MGWLITIAIAGLVGFWGGNVIFIPAVQPVSIKKPPQATTILSQPIKIQNTRGEILFSRKNETKVENATSAVSVRLGDTYYTGNNSVVSFKGDLGLLSLNSNSNVSIVQLVSDRLVFGLLQGTLNVSATSSVEVIIGSVLVHLEAGDAQISFDQKTAQINLASASSTGKIAFLDNQNETKVTTIQPETSYLVNINEKSIITE